MTKSYKMRYHCQVLVYLNINTVCKQKRYRLTNQHTKIVGWYMKNTRA